MALAEAERVGASAALDDLGNDNSERSAVGVSVRRAPFGGACRLPACSTSRRRAGPSN